METWRVDKNCVSCLTEQLLQEVSISKLLRTQGKTQ